jgi:hypothetical protein
LVFAEIVGAMQFSHAAIVYYAFDVMACGHAISA